MDLLDDSEIDIPELGEGNAGASPKGRDSLAGRFFGTYQLGELIGEGGVARVLRAHHVHPGYAEKAFAVKVLHESLANHPAITAFFKHEAYVLSLIKHDNIIETFEAGAQDGRSFIVMEYLAGANLYDLIARAQIDEVPLPLPVCLHILCEVLSALQYAHNLCDGEGRPLHLVHRDINPANVFISFHGQVKLGDFGVALIAQSTVGKPGEVAGKVGYIAPEHLRGEILDVRGDVFAVGVMLFEMLCGRRLFAADNQAKAIKLNTKAKVPKPCKINPRIPPAIEKIILRATERKAARRFASAGEMRAELLPFLGQTEGFGLALAAMMRRFFMGEMVREVQTCHTFAAPRQEQQTARRAMVLSSNARIGQSFSYLLSRNGYQVDCHGSVAGLSSALTENPPPRAILVDVCAPGFAPEKILAGLGPLEQVPPLVAICEDLDQRCIRHAQAISAVDIVYQPFDKDHVLNALRMAHLGRAALRAANNKQIERPVGKKVLLLSEDRNFHDQLPAGLSAQGIELECCQSFAQAIERAYRTSFHVLMVDLLMGAELIAAFVQQVRNLPGIEMLPVLYLANSRQAQEFEPGPCSALHLREEPPATLATSLHTLMTGAQHDRVFARYPLSRPVKLRYGGRVFRAQSINFSRSGILLTTPQMIPMGAQVNLELTLATKQKTIVVSGRIARVDLSPNENTGEYTAGVDFEHFPTDNEARLIAFLAQQKRS